MSKKIKELKKENTELKKQLPITKEKIIEKIIIKYKKCDLVLINGKKLVLRKRKILGGDK